MFILEILVRNKRIAQLLRKRKAHINASKRLQPVNSLAASQEN